MISVFGSKVGTEELNEIKSSIENQWLGTVPKVKRFEKLFTDRLGRDFIMLNSGSNALYMAVKILDLPVGSEIIVPAFTWVACASMITFAGCKPVFCDVDLDTQNVSVKTIAPKITDNTSAIMIVHYAGLPVDVEPIKQFGLPIIEDCAHAVDSKIGSKYVGTIGDVGVFSFDGVKNLAIGEAGGLCASPELIEKALKLRYCGIGKSGFEASANKDRWWEYIVSDICFKMLPDDISASIGIAQLAKLDVNQSYRGYIWEMYNAGLNKGSIILPQNAPEGNQHSYFTYFIRVKNRDKLAKWLYGNGIYTTLRYQPLHLLPIYGSTDRLVNSEILNEEGLNIPLHPNLKIDDVEYIIQMIRDFV